jgi:chromate reductase, NAD(P)H dehydrogenase (quinone)
MQTPSLTIRILAISGSLRQVSSNTSLLNAAITLAPENVEIKLYGGLGELPPFNPDLEPAEPPSVKDLKRQIQWSEGLLISSPEYAHGVPGVLKNALDWLVSGEEFVYKPVALWNASPHATHAQASLTEIITVMSGRLVPEASISVPLPGKNLDAAGIASHPEISVALRTAIVVLAKEIDRYRAESAHL